MPRVIDPADLVAQARSEAGLPREQQQHRQLIAPHPSRGGTQGYSVWYRIEQIEKFDNGQPIDVSVASIYRWKERLTPYRTNGGKGRTHLVGQDQLRLVMFLIAHPDASLDEMATYIFNEGGGLYSTKILSKRLSELQITKKKASIEAYQAMRDDVQERVWAWFNTGPPTGIMGVPRRKLIDVDEFGVTLERCNRKGGWAPKFSRVRKDGHYNHGMKTTVLFAIEPGDPNLPPASRGSLQNPRRWIWCVRGPGTTTIIFHDFIASICLDIEQHGHDGTDDHRIFIWDNLAAHNAAYVHNMVVGRPGPRMFSILARPQHHPKYGPIEYKICDLMARIIL
jgi:transposase